VEISSLLMRRLPRRVWHGIHLTSYAVFWLATFHLLLAGTDAANPIIRWTVSLVMAGVVFLSLVRVLNGRGGAKPTRHATTPTRPGRSQPVNAMHVASREEPPVPEDV
jgi:DMSO/TMAO reductase YedYZ heme-binding membrane subunit